MTLLPTPRRLVVLGLFCLCVQLASARWLVQSFETPNAGTAVARELVATGHYSVRMGDRLWGPLARQAQTPLRYYVLPGEPLYLASMFASMPRLMLRFIHVPVTMLLIGSVVVFALTLCGARIGLATGIVATLQPFVIVHGPVWDDTFLAAALVWLALAIFAIGVRRALQGTPLSPVLGMVAALAVGAAIVTRGDVILFVAALLVLGLASKRLRPIRSHLVACGLVSAIALGCWGARNLAAVGSFEIGSSHDGITLWESNGPHTATALRGGQVMMLSGDTTLMKPYWSDTRTLDEVGANHYFARRALQYAAAHPLDVARLSLRKSFYTITSIRPELPFATARNLVGVMANAVMLILATIGVVVWRRGSAQSAGVRWEIPLLAPLVVTGLVEVLIGPIGQRYRIQLDGVLWICAANGVLFLLDFIRGKRWMTTDRLLMEGSSVARW